MLDTQKISELVAQVVQANTTPTSVRNVVTEPAADGEGEEALRITIVLTPEAVTQFEAGRALDTLVQIQDRLGQAGEERSLFSNTRPKKRSKRLAILNPDHLLEQADRLIVPPLAIGGSHEPRRLLGAFAVQGEIMP